MPDDRDTLLRAVRRHYNRPPDFPPVDAGWTRIAGARALSHVPPARLRTARLRSGWLLAAAATLVIAIGIGMAVEPRELAAVQSSLVFSDATPRRGAALRVEYRPTPVLAREDELVLRARFRTVRGDWENWMQPHLPVARLRRDGSVFTGTMQLPDSVVYAVFAVEDGSGNTVDAHGEQWDLMVHDPSGKPLREALVQRYRDTDRRNSRVSIATARTMRELHPTWAEGWWTWYMAERGRLTASDEPRLEREIRDAMPAMRAAVLGAITEPAELTALAALHQLLGDSAAATNVRRRVATEHRGTAEWVELQLDSVITAQERDIPAMRRGLEALWHRIEPVAGLSVARTALRLADNAGDSDDVARWARRLEPHFSQPERLFLGGLVARHTSAPESVRAEALRLARQSLAILGATRDQRRMITETVATRIDTDRSLQGHYLGLIGRLLHADGRTEAARDTLARAMQLRWNPAVLRALGDLRLADGDTAGAAAAYGWLSADPSTTPATEDTLRRRLGPYGSAAAWASLGRDGALRMAADYRRRSRMMELPSRIPVTDSLGRAVNLPTSTGEGITVVALWSPHCPRAVTELRHLETLARQVSGRGARLLIVSGDPPGDGTPAVAGGPHFHGVYHDTGGAFRQATHEWGYPTYFVLDAAGRVRFRNLALTDVARQVTALQVEREEVSQQ